MKGHNGRQFSTKDQDNDTSGANCAVNVKGAWWYYDCRDSNLNGVHRMAEMYDGTESVRWGKRILEAKKAEMKIKPKGFKH